MSTPRTNTVSTEVSSDAEWIWRASAEVVLPTAVAAGAGRPDSSAGWQPQARTAAPYQDMTVSHCSSRDVTFLASWRGYRVRPGRAGHPSPRTGARRTGARPTAISGSPWTGSHRGRRLDAQPAAEVLARIHFVVDARSLDLWDTAACLQGQAISGPGGLA